MVELKKMELICGSSPRKKQATSPYPSDFLQDFKSCSALTCPPTHSKRRGKAQTTKHSVVPFGHTGICMYIYYVLCRVEGHLTWLGLMQNFFLEITITRFA